MISEKSVSVSYILKT